MQSETEKTNWRFAQTALRIARLANLPPPIQSSLFLSCLLRGRRVPESLEELKRIADRSQNSPTIRIDFSDTALNATVVGLTKRIDLEDTSISALEELSSRKSSRRVNNLTLAAAIFQVCEGITAALEVVDRSLPGDSTVLDAVLDEFSGAGEPLKRILTTLTRGRTVKNRVEMPLLAITARSISSLAADMSASQLTNVAGSDPVLASLTIRAANTAQFGSSFQIQTVGDAVLRLGTSVTRQVLLSALLLRICVSRELRDLWEHSHQVAVTASKLCSAIGVDPDIGFTYGLLHDIGMFAQQTSNTDVLRCVKDWKQLGYPASSAEVLGSSSDHAVLGSDFLQAWNFDEQMVEAVRFHHRPELTENIGASVLYMSEYRFLNQYSELIRDEERLRYTSAHLGVSLDTVENYDRRFAPEVIAA